MLRLSLHENPVDKVITRALQILKKGGIIAYPTESFYALGVMINDETALKKLYKLKNRPLGKAMPVIIGSKYALKSITKSITPQAERLMRKFWPGPLTIIFEAKDSVPELLTGKKKTVAARIPGDSFALYLAKAADFPITATSANLSGKAPAQKPQEVMDYFGEGIDLIIAGGKTPGGKPSTLIDTTVTPPRVLRKGSIRSALLSY
jgi:L-threonylcarbamoyladenylate synthase